MYLDTVNLLLKPEKTRTEPVFGPWYDFPYTTLFHHGKPCCDLARGWLMAMDYGQLSTASAATGPRWLRAHYEWGPTVHPIHWCEAVKQSTLDCGALSALAIACFRNRGLDAFPVQLVQYYPEAATQQWSHRWEGGQASTHWLRKDRIYHEVCGVVIDNHQLRIWDTSSGSWLEPPITTGYGTVLALRLSGDTPLSLLQWGPYCIAANQWQELPLRSSAMPPLP